MLLCLLSPSAWVKGDAHVPSTHPHALKARAWWSQSRYPQQAGPCGAHFSPFLLNERLQVYFEKFGLRFWPLLLC